MKQTVISSRLRSYEKILNKRRRQGGFSLIEIMIVVFIIFMLAAMVGPRMFSQLGKAKTKTAKAQIELLLTATEHYRLDMDTYPTTGEGLEALITNPGSDKWDGPYLKKSLIPDDPWGNPYHYQSPGEHGEVDIYSLGRDNKAGGDGEDADISSWE